MARPWGFTVPDFYLIFLGSISRTWEPHEGTVKRIDTHERTNISVCAFKSEVCPTTGSMLKFASIEIDVPLLKHIPRHMDVFLTFSTSTPDYLHSGRTLTSHVWPSVHPAQLFLAVKGQL